MKQRYWILMVAAVLCVAGCSSLERNTGTEPVTRLQGQSPADALDDEQVVARQANALTDLSDDMLRKATLKGAAIGAVAGCGLAALSNSAKSRCLQAAAAGGAVGALVGHASGQRQVARKVELVSLSRLMPSMAAMDDSLSEVSGNVPALLAAQDAELAQMRQAVALGQTSPEAYEARLLQVRESRAALAEALTLSAANAAATRARLEDAEAQGQDGLAWYLDQSQRLEQDALSARAQIDLL